MLLRLTPSHDQASAVEGLIVRHHIGVFVPLELGRWRALFPDYPGCVAEGPNLEITIYRAADCLVQHVGFPGSEINLSPMSRNGAGNKLDEAWATANGITLRTAVLSMIPLRGNDDQKRAWSAETHWEVGTFVSQPLKPLPTRQLQLEASIKQAREIVV